MSSLRCPKCSHELDDATCVTDDLASPRDGDLSVCIYCGAANFFQDNPPSFRNLTEKDIQALCDEDRENLSRAQTMIALSKAMGRETNH